MASTRWLSSISTPKRRRARLGLALSIRRVRSIRHRTREVFCWPMRLCKSLAMWKSRVLILATARIRVGSWRGIVRLATPVPVVTCVVLGWPVIGSLTWVRHFEPGREGVWHRRRHTKGVRPPQVLSRSTSKVSAVCLVQVLGEAPIGIRHDVEVGTFECNKFLLFLLI